MDHGKQVMVDNADHPTGNYGLRSLQVWAGSSEGVDTVHFVVRAGRLEAAGLQMTADQAIVVRDFLNSVLIDGVTIVKPARVNV